MNTFTIDDLEQILAACAEPDDVSGPGLESGDRTFDQLGYDSLAMLEIASHVKRRFGIDETPSKDSTPQAFVAAVNDALGARAED